MAGDWLGNGSDRLGIFEGEFGMVLSNRFETNAVDVIFAFGQPGDVPVAGNWTP